MARKTEAVLVASPLRFCVLPFLQNVPFFKGVEEHVVPSQEASKTAPQFGLADPDLRHYGGFLGVELLEKPMMNELALSIFLVAFFAFLFKFGIRRAIILEYERGLLYVSGQFKKTLEPGQYWHSPLFAVIQKIDIRPRFTSISGQEILSADGVTLKISIATCYEITDPVLATHKAQNFQETLYLELQLALRAIISSANIDIILKNRNELSNQLTTMTQVKAQDIGLKLISVNIKDILFPGKLKEVFAQVVSARQEGLATLEKARGEMAALRNLANAAKMIESNPALLQLRLLQTLGQSSGNTLMLGMPASSLASSPNHPAHRRESLGVSATESGQSHTTDSTSSQDDRC